MWDATDSNRANGKHAMGQSLSGYRIGFIGLGNMGMPMARHMKQAGAEMVVWNRSHQRLEAAVALGMQAANSPAEVAECVGAGVICINLTETSVVESIVFGPDGLKERLAPEAMVIDFGTTSVPATRQFAESLLWIDAPVSGGQVGAEAATLSIMVGGQDAAVQKAWPILEAVGKRITHLGPSGAGQVTKLANQLIVAQTIDAVAQALRAMLGGFADSRILDLHGDRIVRRDFVAGGRASLQLKDVRLICELAKAVGLTSPTLANSLERWEELVERRGQGTLDHSGLFTLYE
jgi:2-hydroxy-3-oxopropionate reductase